jgi:hypothetical protein
MFNSRVPIYINPVTLKREPVYNLNKLEIQASDWLSIDARLQEYMLTDLGRAQLLMLHNAFAISHFAKNMSKRAKDIDKFKEYSSQLSYYRSRKINVLRAIDILKMSKNKGYDNVRNRLRGIWK